MTKPFNPRLVIFFVLLIGILAPIPVDEYAPSMPAMVHFFGSSVSAIQLTITVFLLALGIGQLVLGPLSDHYGRRVVLIAGVAVFLVGTLICIFADAIWPLMVGRAVQGLGIASCAMTATTLIGDVFAGEEVDRVTSYFSLTYGLVPILSPVIGGHIQDLWGWQANFWFMLIFIGVAFVLIVLKLPETHPPGTRSPLKPLELLRGYTTVLTNPLYMSAVSGITVSWSMIISFSVIGPFLLQDRLHLSAYLYGWSALLVGLGFFLGNLLNTALLKHHGTDAILRLGLAISLLVSLVMLAIALTGFVHLITVMAPTFLIMVGIGLTFPNYYGTAVGVFTSGPTGVANALIGALVLFGTVLYTLVLSAFRAHSPITLAGVYLALAVLSLGSYVMVSKRKAAPSRGPGTKEH